MEVFQNPEQKVTCPFDKSHFIRISKLNTHIAKCAKNHSNIEIVACCFNGNHRIPKLELRYHYEVCPDKGVMESHIISMDDTNQTDYFPIPKNDLPEEDCTWDMQEHHPGYNPDKISHEKNVLRQVSVASAAQRKAFRNDERLRVESLTDCTLKKNNIPQIPKEIVHTKSSMTKPKVEEVAASIDDAIEEDAFHLSLGDRIKKGKNKSYIPKKN